MAINIPIISEFDGTGVKKAVKQFQQLETVGEKAQFAIKKAAVPAAAALAGLAVALGDATQAAMEDQQEQAALALTLQNVTGAGAAQTAQVEKQISAMSRASGVADSDYRKALEALVRGTKDVGIAMKDMTLVMDISTATGMDSASVADALAKAYQGNFKALRSLSPEMSTMIKDGASLAEVQKVLEANFGGAGKAAADTAAGGMKKLAIAFNETKEGIGQAFLPVMEKVLPVVQKFSEWAQANPDLLAAVTVSVGALALSTLALNAAMAVNPFVLMAAGIVAVAVAMDKLANAAEKIKGIGGIAAKIIGSIALPGFAGQVLENTIGRFTGNGAPSVTPSTSSANIGNAGSAERGVNITVNAGVGDPVAVSYTHLTLPTNREV